MVLFAVPWPPQGLYAKKEVNSTADMKGMKFRAYNRGTSRIAELTGAQPITIQAAELSQALATGKVDSFISSGATGVDSKVWEQLTHFYDTQAWLPKNAVLVNKAAFDKLDDATKKAVLAEAAKAEALGWAEAEKLSAGFLETLGQERHEGAAALAQARRRVQGTRQEADRGMAREGRRRRQGRGRRLQQELGRPLSCDPHSRRSTN